MPCLLGSHGDSKKNHEVHQGALLFVKFQVGSRSKAHRRCTAAHVPLEAPHVAAQRWSQRVHREADGADGGTAGSVGNAIAILGILDSGKQLAGIESCANLIFTHVHNLINLIIISHIIINKYIYIYIHILIDHSWSFYICIKFTDI